MVRPLVSISALLLSLSGTTLANVVTPPVNDEPANLSTSLNLLRSYHDSGQYLRDIASVDTKAEEFISSRSTGRKLAIVLDVDETSLSNWDEMLANDFGYFPHAPCSMSGGKPISPCGAQAWDRLERAPAIQPTLALYRRAVALGMTVFFISGRHEVERAVTAGNLVKAGYVGWNPRNLLMEPDDMHLPSAADFKMMERKWIQEKLKYTIVANVGDQWSDLAGGYAERDFKLPNPFYRIP